MSLESDKRIIDLKARYDAFGYKNKRSSFPALDSQYMEDLPVLDSQYMEEVCRDRLEKMLSG